ncbi:hypothetical protein [Undibacterium sp. SXout20W]|uniref:hypothetical protein n=1 Tax=Undibacterium sp. SXout20W TaxID=3413051 RepID=UPI003BF2288C
MIAFLVAAIVSGTSYWNDQLEFGVDVPVNATVCTGLSDAPDRGVYVFLDNKDKCPDLTKTSLYEYVEKERISSISVVAWSNSTEQFSSTRDLAKAYCGKSDGNLFKKNIKGKIGWFCVPKSRKGAISGFFLLNKGSEEGSGVNLQIGLNDGSKISNKEYWNLVNSLTTSKK